MNDILYLRHALLLIGKTYRQDDIFKRKEKKTNKKKTSWLDSKTNHLQNITVDLKTNG